MLLQLIFRLLLFCVVVRDGFGYFVCYSLFWLWSFWLFWCGSGYFGVLPCNPLHELCMKFMHLHAIYFGFSVGRRPVRALYRLCNF